MADSPMKAWRVVWTGMPDIACIVAAPTREQAKMLCAHLVREADYDVDYTEIRATHIRLSDGEASRFHEATLLRWDYGEKP